MLRRTLVEEWRWGRPRPIRVIRWSVTHSWREGWHIVMMGGSAERLGHDYGWFASDDEALHALLSAYPSRDLTARRLT